MARVKVPARATFNSFQYSASHELPFNIVGVLPDGRPIVIGFTKEVAEQVREKMNQVLNGHETNTV